MFIEREKQQAEVDANAAEFFKLLPGIIDKHNGQYALMKTGQIVTYLDTYNDAITTGYLLYGMDNFSVQHVSEFMFVYNLGKR